MPYRVELEEIPWEALVREVREELDIEIEVKDFLETVEYDYPRFHLSMDCFFCTITSGELMLKEHETAKCLTVGAFMWQPSVVCLKEQRKRFC